MVKRDWVKPGAVVIDCGNYQLLTDANTEANINTEANTNTAKNANTEANANAEANANSSLFFTFLFVLYLARTFRNQRHPGPDKKVWPKARGRRGLQ